MRSGWARGLWALAVAGLLAGCGGSGPATGGATTPTPTVAPTATAVPSTTPTATAVPTAAPTATPAPTPVPTPTPGALPAGFACTDVSGGSTATGSAVTAVRVGSHVADGGYDRFVVEFSGTVPGYRVTRQAGTSFEASPSGNPFTLEGTTGIVIRLQPVADWTSYRSPTYFDPGFPYLRQARLLENFEAVQQWALGVDGRGCIRVLTLSNPSRLVVDVAS